MRVLCWLLKKNRGWVTLVLLAAILSNGSQIAFMFFVGELVNQMEGKSKIEQILSGERSKEEILTLFEEKERSLQEVLWKSQARLEELGYIKDRMENEQDAHRVQEMTDEERAWYLAKLVRVNDHNVRQVLSEAIWV